MKAFEANFGYWVIAHRWWVIALTFAAVALAASGGSNLRFTTNYRVFFSADNPQLLAFDALEARFAKSDNVLFVLEPEDGNAFTAKTMAAVEWLTKEAWQVPYSTRVDSLSNFQHTHAEGDDLIVRHLVTNASDLDASAIAQIRKIALAEPLLAGRLVSHGGDITAVNVTVQLPGLDETAETPEVALFARELVEKVRARYPHLRVYLPGMVMMNNAFSESSKLDMQTLVPLSFAMMVIFLGLLLRGLSGTAATVLVIFLSILTAMGLGGWIGFPLSPPSATSPTIILTIAIANCVHVLVTFLHELRAGRSKNDALAESLRLNLQPVFLASLTTAFGFLSMNFSDVPPFTHLGNFVAMGVAAAFVLSVTFLPAVVSLLPVKVAASESSESDVMDRFGEFVVRRRNLLLWSTTAVVVLLVASIGRNELNDVFVRYFDESVQFRSDSDFTEKHLTGLYVLEYSLESGEPGGISNPAFLRDTERFAQWYKSQPEHRHVRTLTDVMKRLNMNMHGDDTKWYRLPLERELAAQYLLLYEMSLPYGLDLNNEIDVEKSALRMTVTIEAGLENLWVILGLFRYWLSELQEPAEASAGGIKGALLRFGGVVDEGATVIVDGAREDLGHGLLT